MLFEIAYDKISLTMKFNIDGEFLGTTSRTVSCVRTASESLKHIEVTLQYFRPILLYYPALQF